MWVFPLGVIFPWQIDIAKKIEIISVTYKLLFNPRVAIAISVQAPDTGNQYIRIAKEIVSGFAKQLLFLFKLILGNKQDIFLLVFPPQSFNVFSGKFRSKGRLIMFCQFFGKP